MSEADSRRSEEMWQVNLSTWVQLSAPAATNGLSGSLFPSDTLILFTINSWQMSVYNSTPFNNYTGCSKNNDKNWRLIFFRERQGKNNFKKCKKTCNFVARGTKILYRIAGHGRWPNSVQLTGEVPESDTLTSGWDKVPFKRLRKSCASLIFGCWGVIASPNWVWTLKYLRKISWKHFVLNHSWLLAENLRGGIEERKVTVRKIRGSSPDLITFFLLTLWYKIK